MSICFWNFGPNNKLWAANWPFQGRKQTQPYNRCDYTEHFHHGKWPFYRGKFRRCVWPNLPEINLSCEISMQDTSKRRKKNGHDIWRVINSIGVSTPKAIEPIRILYLTTTWNRKSTGLFLRTVSGKIDFNIGRFHAKKKVTAKF